MKKGKLFGVVSNFLTVVLGALIFVLMAAPALTIVTKSSLVDVKDVDYSFYSFFEGEKPSQFGIVIIILLCLAVLVALSSLIVAILGKKKKNLVVLLNVLSGLLFIAVAICLFLFNVVEGSGDSLNLGSLLDVSVNLGYGAILGGIVGLVAALVEIFSGALILTKKK